MRIAVLLTAVTLAAPSMTAQRCDPDNAGLTLPAGFCAQVVARDLGSARHMAVAPNGDVFIAVPAGRNNAESAGVWALRDTSGDGRADLRTRVVEIANAQDVELVIGASGAWLYYGTTSAVIRHRWVPGQLTVGPAETIVSGMTDRRRHAPKTSRSAGTMRST